MNNELGLSQEESKKVSADEFSDTHNFLCLPEIQCLIKDSERVFLNRYSTMKSAPLIDFYLGSKLRFSIQWSNTEKIGSLLLNFKIQW